MNDNMIMQKQMKINKKQDSKEVKTKKRRNDRSRKKIQKKQKKHNTIELSRNVTYI